MPNVTNGQIARARNEILPATTWANRPAASSVPAGTLLPVTGFGATSVMFESDGTAYWYPQGGYQVLYHLQGRVSVPVATLIGDGTPKAFVLPRNLELPAGMLFDGVCIEVGAMFLTGTKTSHAGQIVCVLNESSSGTSNAIWSSFVLASTAEQRVRGNAHTYVYAGGVARGPQHSMLGSPAASAGGMPTEQSDANINTEARFVVPCIQSSYTDGNVDLLSIHVALRA